MKNKFTRLYPRRKQVLNNRSAFLKRLAILLEEGYTFHDSLQLLLPHYTKDYEVLLIEIKCDFKEGKDTSQILLRLGFASSYLLPVAIAEQDGRLVETLKAMASRLERADEARKKFRSLITYPAVLFLFINALLLGFRNFFLPNLKTLVLSRQGHEGFSSILPSLVSFLPNLFLSLGFFIVLSGFIGMFVYKKLSPAQVIHLMVKTPVFGSFFIAWKTKFFAHELGQLLDSGLPIQKGLSILVKQTMDPVLSEIASTVKSYVIQGEAFHAAVQLTPGITKELTVFAEHGAYNGHLSKELILYSEQLDEMIHEKITKGFALLQPTLFSLIAICILAAYLAILLPVYGLLNTM